MSRKPLKTTGIAGVENAPDKEACLVRACEYKPSCTRTSYEHLLAIMRAAVAREASRPIDWDAEWGDQREED